MSTALAPVAPSLFELEQDLQSLLDTEDIVDESLRKEFEAELAESLKASVSKRDRCAQFLQHVCLMQENCDKEIQRLQKRRECFERAEKRMKMYVQRVIESLGPDAKGKPKKLEGNLATFSLRQAPGHIEVTDEKTVPDELKSVDICLPLSLLNDIVMTLPTHQKKALWEGFEKAKISIDKREAKRRIEAGEEIPGLDLTVGGYCLVVK